MNFKELKQAALHDELHRLQATLEDRPESAEIQSLLTDLQVHQIELELQNRELREAQRSLEQARDDYAGLYDSAPVGYVTLDRSGKIAKINLTGARMLGRERLHITDVPLSVFLQHSDAPRLFEHLRRVFQGDVGCSTELRITPHRHPPIAVRLESVPVASRGGTIVCQSAMIDVTERSRAEAALRESEDRYRTLFMHSPDAIVVARQVYVTLVNDAALRLFGADESRDLMGRPLRELFHTGFQRLDVGCDRDGRIQDRCSRLRECQIVRLDGYVTDVEALMTPISHRGTEAVHIILRDVSERKALEQEIIEVSTAERERIGSEIHDGVGQELTAISMLANSLERGLRRQGYGPEAETANRLVRQLQQALRDTRSLARGLLPVQITSEGLDDAISVLAERAQAWSGVQCEFHSLGDLGTLTEMAATQLYRIAQEALHNATKHAQANHVAVSLVGRDRAVVLSICDDGVGFDPSAPIKRGLGLHTMRYRAKLIGADLTIAAVARLGTRLECVWPDPS